MEEWPSSELGQMDKLFFPQHSGGMRIEYLLAYGCAGRRNFVLDVCSVEELLNVCAMKAWKACRSSVREMLQERIRLLCILHFLFKAMFREKRPSGVLLRFPSSTF